MGMLSADNSKKGTHQSVVTTEKAPPPPEKSPAWAHRQKMPLIGLIKPVSPVIRHKFQKSHTCYIKDHRHAMSSHADVYQTFKAQGAIRMHVCEYYIACLTE